MARAAPTGQAAATQRVGALASPWVAGALILLGLVAALVTYKVGGSLAVIASAQGSDTLRPRPEWLATAGSPDAVRPFLRAVNYLAIVWPALAFGILIGAAVRSVVPAAWIATLLAGSRARSSLAGAVAGAPLMLCSCCIAPVYTAVQERTSRVGPAGALLLASPSLNPVALALTSMLFAPEIALARVLAALVLVFAVSAVADRLHRAPDGSAASCSLEGEGPHGPREAFAAFGREVGRLARTTLPVIVVGVLVSSLLLDLLPMDRLQAGPFRVGIVLLVGLVSLPLALPTFAEIPLALGLLGAGAPAGAAVAVMVAGPAVNLPSLLTVSRTTTPRHALTLAAGTYLAAVAAGLMVPS